MREIVGEVPAGQRDLDEDRPASEGAEQATGVEARLTLVRMTARSRAEALGVDFDHAPTVLAAARTAIVDGIIGYALLVAEKPA